MFWHLYEIFFPRKCTFCERFLPREATDICPACRRELPYCEGKVRRVPNSAQSVAVVYYEDNVREAVLRYKFFHHLEYRAVFGRMLAMKLAEAEVRFDLITFVPVSRSRLRRRGYDQAAALASAVANELGSQSVRLLRKIRNNPAQSGLHAPERRRANVLGVYRPVHPELLRGKRILLIDDVMTTGATLSECCKTLLDAGACEVSCAAFAMTRRNEKQQVKS